MFDTLTNKFEGALRRLSGRAKLTAGDVDEALAEIRSALLDADVALSVVKDFCAQIRQRATNADILRSLSPDQQVIKIVYEELVSAMGEASGLNLKAKPPVVILLVGLQGSGKTTTAVKLAKLLADDLRRRPALVSLDIYRPAAIEQLKVLGGQNQIEVFPSASTESPGAIAKRALAHAAQTGFDTVIMDTAGRLQIDNTLMDELVEITELVEPTEILLVVDAMTGQEAVNVGKGFDERLDIDGVILTKLDGDARGGAALSMRSTLGKPIKFIGVGEKAEALESFKPDRIASRILGMGDMLTLIEKATKKVSPEDAQALTKKLKKSQFTLEDFLEQLRTINSMGSVSSLMKMIPGFSGVAQQIQDDTVQKEFKQIEAIILSMTPRERKDHTILDGNRRARIARGSGTSVEKVNRLMKQFEEMSKAMKKILKMGPGGLRSLAGMMKAKQAF